MHENPSAMRRSLACEMQFSALAKSPVSHPTSLQRALSIRITASTPETGALFTTPDLHTDCGADRWKKFVLRTSLMAMPYEFEMSSDASIVARWWRGRVHDSANVAIES